MKNYHGDYCPLFATVKNWTAESMQGKAITKDVPCPGWPKDVTTDGMETSGLTSAKEIQANKIGRQDYDIHFLGL